MDALDRILPLAGLLWPTLDCDVSIRRDPSSACASTGAAHLARVFDADASPDAPALAESVGATPMAAAEALAADLARLARPRLDALLRAAGDAPSRRADLADDVARLERAVADLTRERERLRAQLEAAHRAAREGVDLGAWVRRGDVLRLCNREARGQLPGIVAALTVVGALVMDGLELPPEERDLRSEHIQSGEEQGVEGGGHGASVAPAMGCRESRGGQSS